MNEDQLTQLKEFAVTAANHANPKLSGFHVGASILTDKGNIFSGFNVEFDIHTITIHAEVMAVGLTAGAGEKVVGIVVHCANSIRPWFPCGICRQALFEYAEGDVEVHATCGLSAKEDTLFLSSLLPGGFRLNR